MEPQPVRLSPQAGNPPASRSTVASHPSRDDPCTAPPRNAAADHPDERLLAAAKTDNEDLLQSALESPSTNVNFADGCVSDHARAGKEGKRGRGRGRKGRGKGLGRESWN